MPERDTGENQASGEGETIVHKIAHLLMAAAAVLASIGAPPASAQKQTLHMAYWAGPSHQMVQTQAAWIKTIEEASGGNLTVEVDKAAVDAHVNVAVEEV